MRFLWMLLFLVTLNPIRRSYVEGFPTFDKNSFGPKPKGTVKTIEALECGDIIDCVDFYKQPAFDNPSILKDFKNKMDPSIFPTRFNKTMSHQPQLLQTWRKYGECPKGTVPIRRDVGNNTIHRKNDPQKNKEYAYVQQNLTYKGNGAKANVNLWKPRVERSNEFSLSQLWISGGNGPTLNTIEVGWMVYPRLFHDARTRLFVYWTADNYGKTGCYNEKCSAFVVLSTEIALGAALEPISVYNTDVGVLDFIFSRKYGEGDWYLQVGEYELGYYPAIFFTHLREGADIIQFGGEIINKRQSGHHTSTEMGSGHFSHEGLKKASCISNIELMNEHFEWVEPNHLQHFATHPGCYDITLGPPRTQYKSHFYYGGPGFHPGCL